MQLYRHLLADKKPANDSVVYVGTFNIQGVQRRKCRYINGFFFDLESNTNYPPAQVAFWEELAPAEWIDVDMFTPEKGGWYLVCNTDCPQWTELAYYSTSKDAFFKEAHLSFHEYYSQPLSVTHYIAFDRVPQND